MPTNAQQSEHVPVDRKFSIVMTEWNYVQSILKDEVDRKFKVRAWAITTFSALFALSVHQNNPLIVLLTIPAILLFWYMDTVRQASMMILYRRSLEIEQALQNASDVGLAAFVAPVFSSKMGNDEKRREHEKKARFGKVRGLFFGSMVIASIILCFLLFIL